LLLMSHGQDLPINLRASTHDPAGEVLLLYDRQVGALSTPDCHYEWLDPLPQNIDQYEVYTATMALLDGNKQLPLTVAGEYESDRVSLLAVAASPHPTSPWLPTI
jgi:hypothetical protein